MNAANEFSSQTNAPRISRRETLGGILALVALPLLAESVQGEEIIAASEPQKGEYAISSHRDSGVKALPRYQHSASLLNDGRVLVAGGFRFGPRSGFGVTDTPLAGAQIFDPRTNTWMDAASMTIRRARHAAVTLPGGQVMVLGGLHEDALAAVEIYDPAADKWTTSASMHTARYDHTAVCSGGLVVVMGGFNRGPLAEIALWDQATGQWRSRF
jgi:hypothetical protein